MDRLRMTKGATTVTRGSKIQLMCGFIDPLGRGGTLSDELVNLVGI